MLFDFQTQKWSQLAKVRAGFLNWSRDGRLGIKGFAAQAPLKLRDELSCMSESPRVKLGKAVWFAFLRIDVKVDQ
jgi:hypothetical protein